MLTTFGKAVRKYRIDKGVVLREMAEELGVSPAYLSAIETGKKSPTAKLVGAIARYFDLDRDETEKLERLAFQSRHEYRLDVKGVDSETRELVASFARRFSSLSKEQRDKMFELLNDGNRGG